jgi:thiol-disulfide isomerase/thioredoxin
MLERLVITAILIVIGVAGWIFFNRWSVRRLQTAITDPILSGLQRGVPAILYFTTPDCQPCRTLQKPALNALQQEAPVQVIQIDATEQPDVADRWGVFSAPTTFILDRALQPQQVNRGVASTATLKRQIAEIYQGVM